MVGLFPAFRGTEKGQGFLLTLAASQVTSIQNNQYAIVTYFGVVCPEPQLYSQNPEEFRLAKNLFKLPPVVKYSPIPNL